MALRHSDGVGATGHDSTSNIVDRILYHRVGSVKVGCARLVKMSQLPAQILLKLTQENTRGCLDSVSPKIFTSVFVAIELTFDPRNKIEHVLNVWHYRNLSEEA